ncbi:hypothetical protein BG004_004864 [Podila humilis]|nr:hypothetical protein BG004_004864 [Podila humilis]
MTSLSPLDLPFLVEAMAESLSFADLIHCILVSRVWNTAFVPILWTDVITFRSSPHPRPTAHISSSHNYTLSHYFTTPVSMDTFASYAHHIRAVTCSKSTLPALLASDLPNLVEINFIVEPSSSSSMVDSSKVQVEEAPAAAAAAAASNFAPELSHWFCSPSRLCLNGLAKVIAQCPSLRAISIEDLDLGCDLLSLPRTATIKKKNSSIVECGDRYGYEYGYG